MATKLRNLLKTRAQRDGEALYAAHLKSGQADGQEILAGLVLGVGTPNTTVAVSAGEALLAGSVVPHTGTAGQALTGAGTGAGQFLKVLFEITAAGAVAIAVGAIAGSQAAAPLPDINVDRIAIGWVEVPASFVVGTTVVTAGMLKPVPYHL
jgi:hypothetical protein